MDYPTTDELVTTSKYLNNPGPDEMVPGPPPTAIDVWHTEVEWAMAVSPRFATYLLLILKVYGP